MFCPSLSLSLFLSLSLCHTHTHSLSLSLSLALSLRVCDKEEQVVEQLEREKKSRIWLRLPDLCHIRSTAPVRFLPGQQIVCFSCLDLHHKSPNSGERQYKART